MRLSPSERRLQLDDRLAAFLVEPLRDLRQETPQSLGDIRALEEGLGVTVFGRRLACTNGGEVSSELGLLERAGQHVLVWRDNLPPGLEAHGRGSSAIKEQPLRVGGRWASCCGGFDSGPTCDKIVI